MNYQWGGFCTMGEEMWEVVVVEEEEENHQPFIRIKR
jgi:hypothetical protein